jgi:uncharacterized membrane protein YfcA
MSFPDLLPADPFSLAGITILVVAGFVVGVINTVAGSGTIITFSLFMLFGLPAQISNGTVRLGVVMQTLASSLVFRKNELLELRHGLITGIPVTLGTIAGALFAVNIQEEVLKRILGLVMALMLLLMFLKPERWLKGNIHQRGKNIWLQVLLYSLIGVYGGFIHIGVGIFLNAALVWISGYDLVRANALKVFIVLLYSPFTLAIFMLSGQIEYGIGLISAAGNLIGGIVASVYTIKWGAGFIRWFMLVIILIAALSLLDLFHLFT